jgi:hypothetical protein
MFEALIALRYVKDGHTYIFRYTDANRDETLRQIALFAASEELNLNWYDAAKLSQKIRQQPQEPRSEETPSKQDHTQVAKFAAAVEASYVVRGVAHRRPPRNPRKN